MSLQLMYFGVGDGDYKCDRWLSRVCKKGCLMGMLMDMVSYWLFVTVI
jgi:hypothetical protein